MNADAEDDAVDVDSRYYVTPDCWYATSIYWGEFTSELKKLLFSTMYVTLLRYSLCVNQVDR